MRFCLMSFHCNRFILYSDTKATDPIKDGRKEELLGMPSSLNNKDLFFNASVAELRRKAQEHSEALLKNIQSQQNKNDETSSTKPDVDKKLQNDPLHSTPSDGIFNGKLFSKSSLDLGKNLNGDSLLLPNSLPGSIPPMDFSKFPPPNYLSALSNFGLPGLPNMPDFNTSPHGFNPKFASNIAHLIDKSSDVDLKNIHKVAEVDPIENKTLSPGREEVTRNESPERNIKRISPTIASKGDGSRLDG